MATIKVASQTRISSNSTDSSTDSRLMGEVMGDRVADTIEMTLMVWDERKNQFYNIAIYW